jgi:molecular chaperone Hsp33
MPEAAPQSRSIATPPVDDVVLPFRIERAGMFGRIVRLAAVADTVLSRHDYPEPVSRVLGEALALAALIGTSLRLEGRLTLQTRSDGPLRFLVVNFDPPGGLRGYASFDPALADKTNGEIVGVLGHGHLAFTIDPGGGRERQQGIVAVEGGSLGDAALVYFRSSEQLPTFLKLTVARQMIAPEPGSPARWVWRAGGLMIQHIPREGGARPQLPPDTEPGLEGEDDDDWQRVRLLAETVEDHELIDPTVGSERLLYRLFHEDGVRVFDAAPVAARCGCTRERVRAFLKSFGPNELVDMREGDGAVTVTCEFCTTRYRFEPAELDS